MGESFDFSQITSTIIQDDIRTDARQIEALGMRAADALGDAGCARVVLRTDSAATMSSALMACALADCEIVLERGSRADSTAHVAALNAAAELNEDLTLTPMAKAVHAPKADAGFRVLLATSGTTGVPKIAVHSLDTLVGGIRPPRTTDEGRRWLLTYHPASFAGLQVLLTALISGDDLIAVSNPSISRLIEAALTHRPTMLSGTPTFWRAALIALGTRAENLDLAQITLGGEAVDQPTLDRLKTTFPKAAITHIYASTEAGALFAVKDGRAGFPAGWLEKTIEGVRMRIRDGILEVRSPRRMQRYAGGGHVNKAPLTADGWLITGDRVEPQGDRVVFLGRADSLINVGGMKVSPEEIEATLMEVHGVADVRAYGKKNPITGFLVSADIVLDDLAEPEVVRGAVTKHAQSRLDAYKVPRAIRFIDKIEHSETGKKTRRQ
jgi:acyl-coenzyme A synthetase/AMP-(fatty) acid ligase